MTTWRVGAALVALGVTWLITDRVLLALFPLSWGGPNIGGGLLILVALVVAATGVVLLVLGGVVLFRSRPRPARATVLMPVAFDAALVLILIVASFVLPDDTRADGRLAGINGQVGVSVDADGALVAVLEVCAGSVDTVTVVGPNRGEEPNEVFAELTAPAPLTAPAQVSLLAPPSGWAGVPTSLPVGAEDFLIISASGAQSELLQVELTLQMQPSSKQLGQTSCNTASTAPITRGIGEPPRYPDAVPRDRLPRFRGVRYETLMPTTSAGHRTARPSPYRDPHTARIRNSVDCCRERPENEAMTRPLAYGITYGPRGLGWEQKVTLAARTHMTASGLEALALSCDLLHRVRGAAPRAGTWEAADLQWWWRVPRATDDLQQSFVVDDAGPLATARLTAWSNYWGLDVMGAPGSDAAWTAVAEQAWRMAQQHGVTALEALVAPNDRQLIEWLEDHGFAASGQDGTGWLSGANRPDVPVLPEGYRLVDRSCRAEGEHPMAGRNGPRVEHRLKQLSLYDPRLDLALLAPDGDLAGYAPFWHDAATRVGLVEPVRVEDAHSGQGLAFAMVAAGLDRLATAGSTQLKISWDSERARRLYTRLGFTDHVLSTLYRWDQPD